MRFLRNLKKSTKNRCFCTFTGAKNKKFKNRALYVFSVRHKESIKKKIMKIRHTVASKLRRTDLRTNVRTYEAKIIGPFGLRPGTNNKKF